MIELMIYAEGYEDTDEGQELDKRYALGDQPASRFQEVLDETCRRVGEYRGLAEIRMVPFTDGTPDFGNEVLLATVGWNQASQTVSTEIRFERLEH